MSDASARNAELVDGGDIDELLRHIDRLCDARDWHGLDDLRHRSRAALERGRQLWPVASHAEYRLALEAPGQLAASTLRDGAGRFALGPLPEVAASTHAWDELAPHAPPGPMAALAAHERVVRGEDLTGDKRVLADVLDIPLALQTWEPGYPVATYRADEADFDDVPAVELQAVALSGEVGGVDDPDGQRALTDLAAVWVRESNGHARAVTVHGTALDAVASLVLGTESRTSAGFGAQNARDGVGTAAITLADALARMAWTAASGGAHGRRAGMASGRFAAWWTLATLTGLADQWPPDPDQLGERAASLRWFVWEPAPTTTGWSLRIAVENPTTTRAWALAASDLA